MKHSLLDVIGEFHGFCASLIRTCNISPLKAKLGAWSVPVSVELIAMSVVIIALKLIFLLNDDTEK